MKNNSQLQKNHILNLKQLIIQIFRKLFHQLHQILKVLPICITKITQYLLKYIEKYKYSHNIYTSFQPNFKLKPVQDKVRGLIMGHCGVGKTYFINNACNKNHDTGAARGSLTRDIVYEDVAYFEEGRFRIYDTPGSNSSIKAYQHALILRASLTSLPLNLVIIQSKFDPRIDPSIDELDNQLKIFKGYESMVVFLVSCIDQLDGDPEKQKTIKLFGQALKQLDINAKVILYSNKNSDFGYLTHLLFKIGCQNKFIKIQIDDNTFYKYFKLSKSITAKHSQEIDKYVGQIRTLADSIINFSKEIPKNNQTDTIFSELKLYMKHVLKELQNKQYQVYYEKFENEASVTDLYLMISQYIVSRLEELDNICNMKIQKKFYEDSYKKQFDVRDLFKKCPYCDLTWMRVRGCNNTTCGKKPGFFDYVKNKIFFKYEFTFESGKLSYRKNDKKKIQQNNIKKIEQKKLTKKSQLLGCFIIDGKVGCGRTFNWDLQPRLPNIEEMLKQFYGVSNPEQIKLELQKLEQGQQNFMKEVDNRVNQNLKIMQKDRM